MLITKLGKSVVLGAAMLAGVIAFGSEANADLLALYEFEGNVLDSSGNGNDASVVGTEAYSGSTPGAISGRSSQSFDLNGSTYIALPVPAIDFWNTAQSTGASMSIWVQTAGGVDQDYVFSVGNSANNTPIYGLQGDPGDNAKQRVFYRNDASGSDNETGTDNVFGSGWHHVVLTDNGGTTQVWIDGSLDSTLNQPVGTSTHDLASLGALVRTSAGFHLTGQIDEAAFFDHVLSQSEIVAIAGGAAIPEPASVLLMGLGSLMLLRRRHHA